MNSVLDDMRQNGYILVYEGINSTFFCSICWKHGKKK